MLPADLNSLLIRPATQQDATTIYRFLCELEEQLLDYTAFLAVYQHNLADPWVHYLVAEQGDERIGFISCHVQHLLHHAGKVGEIQELYVQPAYRNQCVGYQLVKALDALAEPYNFVNLEVTTNRLRLDTHRFYERLGFQPTHLKFVKALEVAQQ